MRAYDAIKLPINLLSWRNAPQHFAVGQGTVHCLGHSANAQHASIIGATGGVLVVLHGAIVQAKNERSVKHRQRKPRQRHVLLLSGSIPKFARLVIFNQQGEFISS